MAKKVTGTFGEEKIVLNNAATETTLEKLLEAIKNMPGASESEKEKAAKATRDYADSVDEANEAQQDYTDTLEESRSSLGRMTNGLGSVLGIMGFFGRGLENLTDTFFRGGNTIEDVFEGIPVIHTFAKVIQDNVTTFREVSQVGASFGNSISNMRIAAARSEMSLDGFQDMVADNAESMATLGGTVSDGARRFGELSQDLRTSEIGEQFMGMGMTLEELNEGMANFITLQARQGRISRMTDAEIREGSEEYIKQLDALARLTGQSRKEQANLIAQNQAQANIANMRSKLEGEQLANFDASMAAATGISDEFGTVMADLADGVAQTEFGKKLMGQVPEFGTLAQQMAQGEISSQEFYSRLQDLAPELQRFRDNLDPAMVEQLMGREGFGELLKSITGINAAAARAADAGEIEAEQERRHEISQSLLGFEQTINTIRSKIVHTLLTSGVFDDLMGMLEGFADTLSPESIEDKMSGLIGVFKNFKSWFGGFLEDVNETDFVQAFKDNVAPVISKGVDAIISSLTKGLINAITSPAVLATVAGSIGALFAAKKLKDKIFEGFSSLFSGGDDDRKRRSSRGRGTGGIGRTLKGLGTGLLGGIAKGLMMFANPVILKGATILGASIGIIGAGIAGATWLLGKSLPSLSEGMQSFEDLDGDALLKAGAGMAAVAGGLAAFGAGSAVAGIGNLVGTIANGIANLFGGDDPLDQLKEFEQYDFNREKIKNNADSLIAFSNAMAVSGKGQAFSGLGNLIGGWAKGIAKLFGGDDPLDQLKEFEQYDFNKERIQNNADALIAFSEAMAASGKGNAVEGLGDLVGHISKGIVSFFGGDTGLPYDKVREFSTIDLGNAGKIEKNADILSKFSKSLKNFPEDMPTFSSGGVFDSIGSFFKGDKQMPWDKMNEFAQVTLTNPEQLSKNISTLSDFGRALKEIPDDLPTFEGSGFFSKIGNFFGGQDQMPWDAMNSFAEVKLRNPDQLNSNIDTLAQFGRALKEIPDDLPTSKGEGALSKMANYFTGQQKMPWDRLQEFGRVDLDNEKISQNAESLKVFGDVLSDLQASGIQEGLEIPRLRLDRISKAVNNFSDIDQKSLENIRTMSKDLERLSSFNENLDTNPVNDYTEAVKALTDALSNLNEEIADNPSMGVTTPNASTGRTGDTDTQSQSTEQLNRLNTIMTDILGVLLQSNDMNKKQLRSTRAMTGDLYRGV